ncbi:MAG: hypothetical protein KBD53_06845 [Candidatus Omnitrophica bacterium]|nr:hypothetical protein [Candidatus Omnitrophota bacterium]
MKNRFIEQENKQTNSQEHLLKVTALLYLKEALYKEKYEECLELITVAKRYGVEQEEIQKIISRHVLRLKKGLVYEASAKEREGRLSF